MRAEEAATPQPAPTAGRGSVVDDLVTFLHARREFGRRKYGTELRVFNGRDPYIDALQELVDLCQYLHQAQMERAQLEAELAQVKAALETAEQLLGREAKGGAPAPEAAVVGGRTLTLCFCTERDGPHVHLAGEGGA